MEYPINKLAKIAGVSTRTLRYYDEIGLLAPARLTEAGYRIYGEAEVDALQQILFYRALGVELGQIKTLLHAETFHKENALAQHLAALLEKRVQLDALIENARRTILAMKGEITMKDTEKFEGFKQELVDENERQYGVEIRAKYGDDAVDSSHARIKGMTQAQYEEAQRLAAETNETLGVAFQTGDPAGELAQKACALHEKWLRIYYPKYSRAYHRGLGQMYAADERFAAYYEKIAIGCTAFFRDAIEIYCQ